MRYFLVATLLIIAATSAVAAENADFVGDVVPILQKYCAACHSEEDAEGGLSMDS